MVALLKSLKIMKMGWVVEFESEILVHRYFLMILIAQPFYIFWPLVIFIFVQIVSS